MGKDIKGGDGAFITWRKRLYSVEKPGNIQDNVNGCIVARFHFVRELSCVKIFSGMEVWYFIRGHCVKIPGLEKNQCQKIKTIV